MKQLAYVPTLMMISLQNCIKQVPKELKELKDPVKETEHQRTSIVLKQTGPAFTDPKESSGHSL